MYLVVTFPPAPQRCMRQTETGPFQVSYGSIELADEALDQMVRDKGLENDPELGIYVKETGGSGLISAIFQQQPTEDVQPWQKFLELDL